VRLENIRSLIYVDRRVTGKADVSWWYGPPVKLLVIILVALCA
jgi:hypothetical protein